MVAHREFSWEEITSPAVENPARQAWRQAVDEVAASARKALPASHGRIDAAVKLVLQGDVEVLEDGTARVGSQSSGTTLHTVENGTCTCPDVARAPQSWCKHRLALALLHRATTQAKARLAQLDHATAQRDAPAPAPAAVPEPAEPPLPQGLPGSLQPFVVHLHGKPFIQYAGLVRRVTR